MPTFRFDGPARDYPFTRDAQGQNLGRVEPGDEREFEQAPDQWWVPADGETPDPAAEGGTGEPEPHDAEPDEPEAPHA